MPRKYENAHARNHARQERLREREREALDAFRATVSARRPKRGEKVSPAVELYRREKQQSEARNADKKAEIRGAVERALAKADADRNPRNRPGRPKRLPALHLKSDPANALINALNPWGFGE